MTDEEKVKARISAARVLRDLTTIQGLADLIAEAGESDDGGEQADAMRFLAPAIKKVAEATYLFVKYELVKEAR